MKTLLKLEELAQVLLAVHLFSGLAYAWWIFPLVFFTPDVSLLVLLANKRLGTPLYNLAHHKALALGAYLVGSVIEAPMLALAGVVLLGHASFDRLLGFSLLERADNNRTPLERAQSAD